MITRLSDNVLFESVIAQCCMIEFKNQLLHPFDHVFTTNKKRYTLVQVFGLDIHNTTDAIRRLAPCLLHYKSQWIAFVLQPQLAFRIFFGSGIDIDTTFDQVAMKIGNERTNVTGAVWPRCGSVVLPAPVDVGLHSFAARIKIAFIDTVYFPVFRNAHIFMRQTKFSDTWLQGKTIDSMSGCVNQHGRRAINHITGSHLLISPLQKIIDIGEITHAAFPAKNAKNRTDRNVYVNV